MGGLSIWCARFCTFAKRLALIAGCVILSCGTKGEENAISPIETICSFCGDAASRRLRCRRRDGSSSTDASRTVAAANVSDDLCACLRYTGFFTKDFRQFLPGKSGRLPGRFKRPVWLSARLRLGRTGCRSGTSATSGQQARQTGRRRLHPRIYAGLRAPW